MSSLSTDILQVPQRGFALRKNGTTVLVGDMVRYTPDDFMTYDLEPIFELARDASAIVVIERPYPDVPLEHCLRPEVMQAVVDILASGPLTCEIFIGRRSALPMASFLAKRAPSAKVYVATAFGLFRRDAA